MSDADTMSAGVSLPLRVSKAPRDAAPYECEQYDGVCPVNALRAALARETTLVRERDALIKTQATLSRESEHRFLNNLQMVSSLLSMQSRAAFTPEATSALALAAERVATIGRIHRHLHSNDGVESVAFKHFLEELCRDVTAMVSAEVCADGSIVVEGGEIELATAIGIPLGFIASELITNAFKYGEGPIRVRLVRAFPRNIAFSVENAGPALPEEFDPAASKGFGMRIIRSFTAKIGGELRFGRGSDNRGALFTVVLPSS